MLKIIHRVNSIEMLQGISTTFGVEVDIRKRDGKLILQHEPDCDGEDFAQFLESFKHALLVAEVKEEGIEEEVIALLHKKRIENYFLLSVSPPRMYALSEQGVRKLAVRFSEWEGIETALAMHGKVDWVWIDTFSKNPLTSEVYAALKSAQMAICLVSPDRWERAADIKAYKTFFAENDMAIDAIMIGAEYADEW